MINVVCTIAIVINIGGIGWMNKADVRGRIIKEGESKYLVDFSGSKQAKDKDTVTDLSQPMLVEKKECVEE